MGRTESKLEKSEKREELEIDFGENYKVEDNRAAQIRLTLEALRKENWLSELRLVATELGTEELAADDKKQSTLGGADYGFLFSGPTQIFRKEKSEFFPFNICLSLCGAELILSFEGKSLLEVSFFPQHKGQSQDFAVYFVDEANFQFLPELMAKLSEDIAKAKSVKSARVPHFKNLSSKGQPSPSP